MSPDRRHVLRLSAAAAVAPLAALRARAAGWPDRPARIIVPVAPGGALDIIARLIAQRLGERLGQTFLVENRPGAATNIGIEAVVRAAPDGYTLLLVPGSVTVNATLYDDLPFDFLRDIAPIALITRLPLVMETNLAVPARDVKEFIAWGKANRGKVSMATSGIGTPQHMAGELFNQMTGLDMTPVPFGGGGPALVSLIGEQVQVMFSPLPESIGSVRDDKVRALAVTTAERLSALPDTPTVAETIPGFEAISWQGLGAPKGTAPEIVERLNKEVNAIVEEPAISARLRDLGSLPAPMSVDAFRRFIVDETDKWSKVIRAAHMKAR